MEHLAMDFSHLWRTGPSPAADFGSDSANDVLSPSQQLALDELAERVNAARAIV